MKTIDPRLWTDPEFKRFSPDAKLVYLCWMTGAVSPHALKDLTGLSDQRVNDAVQSMSEARRSIPGWTPGLRRHVSKHTHPPAVYFVQAGEGHIKIGWTGDIEARLSTLQIGTSEDLYLLALILGGQAAERRLHQKFAQYRVRGEWFEDCEEIRDYIHAIERGEVEELA